MAKRPRTPETAPVTLALVSDAVQPIIDWIFSVRGRKTEFVNEFRRSIAPEETTRNQVESWLNPNTAKRVEPGFGYGLALVATAERMGIYKEQRKPQTNPAP